MELNRNQLIEMNKALCQEILLLEVKLKIELDRIEAFKSEIVNLSRSSYERREGLRRLNKMID